MDNPHNHLTAFRGKIQALSYSEPTPSRPTTPTTPTTPITTRPTPRPRTHRISVVSATKKLEDSIVPPGTLSDSSSLPWLQELVCPDLKCVFVGYNPSIMSSKTGHRYAHPTNQFWSLIFQSGIVPDRLTAYNDRIMPKRYRIGFTDLVARPTRRASDLSREEMNQGAKILEERISLNKPKCVCIVGKGIWECIQRARGNRMIKQDFSWGLQPERDDLGSSRVFVIPSTSGLVAGITRETKLAIWTELAEFLQSMDESFEQSEEMRGC